MAKFQHSNKHIQNTTDPEWTDELNRERQSNKSTVKDLIHLYDQKEDDDKASLPPTHSGGVVVGGRESSHQRTENYYSEEPRQQSGHSSGHSSTNKAGIRRQHSQPRHQHSHYHHHHHHHSKHSNSSEREGRRQVDTSPWSSTREATCSPGTTTNQRRSSLASKSWATPDDVKQSRDIQQAAGVVGDPRITYGQRGGGHVAVGVSSTSVDKHRGEGHHSAASSSRGQQTTSVQSNRAYTTTTQVASGLQVHSDREKEHLGSKDNGHQQKSRSSQNHTRQIERHSSYDSKLVLQPDSRVAEVSRSRPPDKTKSRSPQHQRIERHRSYDPQFVLQPDSNVSEVSRSRPPDKNSREKPLSPGDHRVNVHNTGHQPDSGVSQVLRSRPLKKTSRERPPSNSDRRVNVHNTVHTRTRSQSPRTHLTEHLSTSSRGQSPSVQVKGQVRTPHSSSTPRHNREHRDSPSEHVTRSQHQSNTTPPPVQYNRQTFRSRSQSPHVNRNKDVLLSKSHQILQAAAAAAAEPQSYPVQRVRTGQTLQQHHPDTRVSSHGEALQSRNNTQSKHTEHLGNRSHTKSQSPHISATHNKQDSNVSSSTSASQSIVSRSNAEINTFDKLKSSQENLNQTPKLRSQHSKVIHRVSSEGNMRVEGQSNHDKEFSVGTSAHIQYNNEKVSFNSGQDMLQGKPPFQMKMEHQAQHGDAKISSGYRGNHPRSRQNYYSNQDIFNGNTQTNLGTTPGVYATNEKSSLVHSQSASNLSGNNKFNDSSKESSRLYSSSQQRERLCNTPQAYAFSTSGNMQHDQSERTSQEQLSYAQIGGFSKVDIVHCEASPQSSSHKILHQRSASQPISSNAANDYLPGRGSYTPSPTTHRDIPINQQQRIIKNDSHTPSPTHKDSPTTQQQQRVKQDHQTPSPTQRPISQQQRQNDPASPRQRGTPVSRQQRVKHDHQTLSSAQSTDSQHQGLKNDPPTPSPIQKVTPVNQQQKLKNDPPALSPTQRHCPINQQQGLKNDPPAPSPTQRYSPINQQQRLNNDPHTPSPTQRHSPFNKQQKLNNDPHTPSPTQRYSPINQQKRLKNDPHTPSPTQRHSPINKQQGLKNDPHTPSPTQRYSPINKQQRLKNDPLTPSPTQRYSPVSQQKRLKNDPHTPSPTQRYSPVNHQKRLKNDPPAPSATQRYSPLNQQQRQQHNNHTPSPTTNHSSANDQQQRALPHPQSNSPAHATTVQTNSPENQGLKDSPQSNASLIEDEYFHPGLNYIQTYTLSQNIVGNSTKPSQSVSQLTYAGDTDTEFFDNDESFVQTYSLSKPPPQDQRKVEEGHIETYTIGGQETPKTFVETYSISKEPEASKLSDISRALLGRSRDRPNRVQLQRSQSADVEKILSGPREKWNIDPPAPCGTGIWHQRKMPDEPLADPTYSYVRTGQMAVGQSYPGEGDYSELHPSQTTTPQLKRHASYDGSMGGHASSVPVRPDSTPQVLHYMSSPLFPPDYEVIPDSDDGSYEEPVMISQTNLFSQDRDMKRSVCQGEIAVHEDEDDVLYLEPVPRGGSKLKQLIGGHVCDEHHKNTHRKDIVGHQQQPPQDKVFVRSNSQDLVSQSVRPSETHSKNSEHSQSSNTGNRINNYGQNRLSVPLSETTGSSSYSDGSRTSPDSVKRSYTATMIGSKSTMRQVTLLESNPTRNSYYIGGTSEEDVSVANNFEPDISGLPESFQPSSAISEDDSHMVLYSRRHRKFSRDRTLSIHSASSMPDLQEIGNMAKEIRKSNEALHVLTKTHNTLKSEMSKSFELLYKQTSQIDHTSHKKVTKQYRDVTIHRVFKHVAQSVLAFSMSWKKLLGELFHAYPIWFIQWIEQQVTKETRIEKECIHECLVQWKEFQASMTDVELMIELKRVLENIKLAAITVGINKILTKDKDNREQYIEYLDDRILTSLALEIGNEWKSLGIFLGFSYQELQRMESNNHKNMGAAIQEMLIAWKNRYGPSVNVLIKGFAEVHRIDLVDRLQPVFRSCDTVREFSV